MVNEGVDRVYIIKNNGGKIKDREYCPKNKNREVFLIHLQSILNDQLSCKKLSKNLKHLFLNWERSDRIFLFHFKI